MNNVGICLLQNISSCEGNSTKKLNTSVGVLRYEELKITEDALQDIRAYVTLNLHIYKNNWKSFVAKNNPILSTIFNMSRLVCLQMENKFGKCSKINGKL